MVMKLVFPETELEEIALQYRGRLMGGRLPVYLCIAA